MGEASPQLEVLTASIEALDYQIQSLIEEVKLLRKEKDNAPQIPERLSGIKVAELLGIKPATVRKCWAEFGLVRVGRASHGRHLYSKESVLRHIQERENGNY